MPLFSDIGSHKAKGCDLISIDCYILQIWARDVRTAGCACPCSCLCSSAAQELKSDQATLTYSSTMDTAPRRWPTWLLSSKLSLFVSQLTGEQAKLKVDVLGRLLKKHVTNLRTGSGQEADLVFLVDSSASVGAENFYNEIKFIRKLLADFTVSHNTTRVVVITYSSVNQVIRQVDYMTSPDIDKHKCTLFEREIPSITYNSGGTYTLGALIEAQAVFKFSRPSARKAVFLITDGYSNGG